MSYAPSHDRNPGLRPVRPSSVSLDALGNASAWCEAAQKTPPHSQPRWPSYFFSSLPSAALVTCLQLALFLLFMRPCQAQPVTVTGNIPYAKALPGPDGTLSLWSMADIRRDKDDTVNVPHPQGMSVKAKDDSAQSEMLGYHSKRVEKTKGYADKNKVEKIPIIPQFSGTLDMTGAVLPAMVAILVDDKTTLTVDEDMSARASGVTGPAYHQTYPVNGTALWNPISYKEFDIPLPPGRKYKLILDYENAANLTEQYGGKTDVDGVSVYVCLTPVDLAIDANRDGTIAQGETASQEKPFRFWINNDSDTGQTDEEKYGSTPDYQSGRIANSRDLEDFELLKVSIPSEIFDKVRQNQAQLGLKWKNISGGTPGVKVFRVSEDIHESKDYLWKLRKTYAQTSSPYYLSIATVESTSTTWLLADALVRYASTEQHPYLLFEGSAKGKGQLCLVIKMNGTETDGPGVWLDLVDVQKMFESANGTPPKPYPNPPDYVTQEPPRPSTGYQEIYWTGRDQFQADPDETDEAIILVHGWNMTDSDRITFSETFFKRLWWKGFKGRFCTFAWPTYCSDDDALGFIPDHYNKSEYVGWKYGPALKAYVDSVSKSSKNVAAHSMGNIVMASALKSGLSVSSYVAMEAAIPAGCYDASAGANSYLKFLQAEQTKGTPDLANPDLGYRGEMTGISGNFFNFHNVNDFALKTGKKAGGLIDANWEGNQVDYKPDGSLDGVFYKYKPTEILAQRCQLEHYQMRILRFGRYVTDHHEIMSFVARPRSVALGTQDTAGFINFDMRNPSLRYPFGGDRTEHSGQFQRPIQKTHKFFNMLLQRMNVGFNPLTDIQVGDAAQ